MSKKVELVIIDPQNDFCDPNGSLSVDGADADMTRVADLVKRIGKHLSDINVTLDSHHDVDVAHPIFWRNSENENPKPFTIISSEDVINGVWQPAVPSKALRERTVEYVKQLDAGGRYPLCIWPPHCVIGSWGHNIFPELHEALRSWETEQFATLTTVTKGSNPYTEHYSAIKAEVPDPNDPTTQINTDFIQKLLDADDILISGEALSHCVKSTFEDAASEFGSDEYLEKLVILTDASTSVPGFEKEGQDFVNNLIQRGARHTTTKDYLA